MNINSEKRNLFPFQTLLAKGRGETNKEHPFEQQWGTFLPRLTRRSVTKRSGYYHEWERGGEKRLSGKEEAHPSCP